MKNCNTELYGYRPATTVVWNTGQKGSGNSTLLRDYTQPSRQPFRLRLGSDQTTPKQDPDEYLLNAIVTFESTDKLRAKTLRELIVFVGLTAGHSPCT